MSYKKPKVVLATMKEKVYAASGKKSCDDRGCCVRSLKHY